MEYTRHYDSPVGGITLYSDGKALTGLRFDRQKYYVEPGANSEVAESIPVLDQTVKWLDIYFGGRNPSFTPALAPSGTPFQEAVWRILLTIPYGETATYGDIAAQIAKDRGIKRMSAQAVGGAVGRNPIGIIVPCHRVIGSDGSLTGYAGGLDKKEKLLALELKK